MHLDKLYNATAAIKGLLGMGESEKGKVLSSAALEVLRSLSSFAN
jgi:hypothetical protein